MLSTYFYDYLVIFGTVNAVIITVLLILVTQYKYFFNDPDKPQKGLNQSKKIINDSSAPQVTNITTNVPDRADEKEKLNKLGYTEERLKEIARCARLLQDYEPPGEVGSGEPACLMRKQIVKPSNFPLKNDLLSADSDGINDTDSLAVNLPDEEDQDDIDISELTPDDIALDEDVGDDEEDGQISPEAIADIEAELMDSSILNECSEEEEEASSVEPTIAGDQLDDAAVGTANLASVMALGELGVETIIRDLRRGSTDSEMEQSSDEEEIDDDEVFIEGKNLNKKLHTGENVRKEGSVNVNIKSNDSQSLRLCNDDRFSSFISNSVCGGEIGDHQHFTRDERSMPNFIHPLENLADDMISVEIQFSSGDEEPQKASSQTHSIQEKRLSISSEDSDKPSPSIEKYKGNARSRVDTNIPSQRSLAQDFLDTDITTGQEKVFLSATKVVSDYVINKARIDAIGEVYGSPEYDSHSPQVSGHGLNMEKAAKIQLERRKLSEEEMAEEQRIQQTQLSNILALMEQNPEMFGKTTHSDMKDQANLYCM